MFRQWCNCLHHPRRHRLARTTKSPRRLLLGEFTLMPCSTKSFTTYNVLFPLSSHVRTALSKIQATTRKILPMLVGIELVVLVTCCSSVSVTVRFRFLGMCRKDLGTGRAGSRRVARSWRQRLSCSHPSRKANSPLQFMYGIFLDLGGSRQLP